MKSNLLKSGIMFASVLVLVTAVTMTAYAIADGAINDNGGGMSEQLIQDALVQETTGAAIAVYQVGESDNLAEIINGIIDGSQGIPFEQGNCNIIIIVPAQGQGAVDDMIATATSIAAPPTTPAPAPPVQTVSSALQAVLPTTSQTTATPIETSQPQNRVEIITRAEQSGNPLDGASFTVYRADDKQRVGEVTTATDGRASISLTQGEYYLRNDSVQYGYLCERSRIFFDVGTNGDVTAEITIQRDASIPDVEDGNVTVPKTGELPPVLNYMLGTVFLAFALFCGIVLLRERKRYSYKRKGALAYA